MTREQTTLSGGELGGPGRADPSACALVAVRLLSGAAADLPLTSITVEMAAGRLEVGGDVVCEVRIDKRTRTVAFATLEARSGGALLFVARALLAAGD